MLRDKGSESTGKLSEIQNQMILEILKMDQIRKSEKYFISKLTHVGEGPLCPEEKMLNLAVGQSVMFVIPPPLDRYGLDMTQDKANPNHFKVSFKNVDSQLDLYVLPSGAISAPLSQMRAFYCFYEERANFRKLISELESISSKSVGQAAAAKKEKAASVKKIMRK